MLMGRDAALWQLRTVDLRNDSAIPERYFVNNLVQLPSKLTVDMRRLKMLHELTGESNLVTGVIDRFRF